MSQIQQVDERGIVLSSMQDVQQFALDLVHSSLCPSQYRNKPADAVVAIVAGRAVGLSPLQSLTGIAVINGRATMFGEARAAVVLAGGQVEWVKEWFELDGKEVLPQGAFDLKTAPSKLMACWQAKRTDQSQPTEVVRFAVGDAKLANLWGKSGPWTQYPWRMMRMRSRAFGERDYFADALHGIAQAEEMMDIKRHGKDSLEVEPAESDGPAESVDGEIIDEPKPVPEQQFAKFMARVAKKRDGASSLSDADFVAIVLAAEFGPDQTELAGLAPEQFKQVGEALAASKYDWSNGERLPE